jgi:hypothetical protein
MTSRLVQTPSSARDEAELIGSTDPVCNSRSTGSWLDWSDIFGFWGGSACSVLIWMR